MIDPRRSLSAPTPVSRAEECGRGREGDVAFGDAPITKYHPRGPGLRLVKRYYYTCAGSPRGIADPNTYPTHRGTGDETDPLDMALLFRVGVRVALWLVATRAWSVKSVSGYLV